MTNETVSTMTLSPAAASNFLRGLARHSKILPHITSRLVDHKLMGEAGEATAQVMATFEISRESEISVSYGADPDTVLKEGVFDVTENLALDLDEMLLLGDTASEDPFLRTMNGLIELPAPGSMFSPELVVFAPQGTKASWGPSSSSMSIVETGWLGDEAVLVFNPKGVVFSLSDEIRVTVGPLSRDINCGNYVSMISITMKMVLHATPGCAIVTLAVPV